MKKWIVYCHTLNNKMYIGYTGKGLMERLEGHIKEALSGSDRHFCRAIKKYGAENITSKILFETNDLNEVKRKEREYIKRLKTFENGYNMTAGGDGGNTIIKYKNKQINKLKDLRSQLSTGLRNGNCAGKSREEILCLAATVLIENNMNWIRSEYMKRASDLGYPVNIYCSGMFIKSWKEDLLEYMQSLGYSIKKIKYKPTTLHLKNNKGVRKKGGKWYYNDKIKKSKYFNPEEQHLITKDWCSGRKLKWD